MDRNLRCQALCGAKVAPARWLRLGAAPRSRSAVPGGRSHPSWLWKWQFLGPPKNKHHQQITNPWSGWWLSLPLWKMMDFVSWDDDIPNIWKNQPVIHVLFFLFAMCKHQWLEGEGHHCGCSKIPGSNYFQAHGLALWKSENCLSAFFTYGHLPFLGWLHPPRLRILRIYEPHPSFDCCEFTHELGHQLASLATEELQTLDWFKGTMQ